MAKKIVKKQYLDKRIHRNSRKHPRQSKLGSKTQGWQIYDSVKTLPHTISWGEEEFMSLYLACEMINRYYSDINSPPSLITSATKILNDLGWTGRARMMLGIEYIPDESVNDVSTSETNDKKKLKQAQEDTKIINGILKFPGRAQDE